MFTLCSCFLLIFYHSNKKGRSQIQIKNEKKVIFDVPVFQLPASLGETLQDTDWFHTEDLDKGCK